MKLSEIKARLFPVEQDATVEDVSYLVFVKAKAFAEKKIMEAEQSRDIARAAEEAAEESAKMQIKSLQTMYIALLTECHQEIADLNRRVTMKRLKENQS